MYLDAYLPQRHTKVNRCDIGGLYNLEKSSSRLMDNGLLVTLRILRSTDKPITRHIFAGIFYLCRVPVLSVRALSVYFRRRKTPSLCTGDTPIRSTLIRLCRLLYPSGKHHTTTHNFMLYHINYGFRPILNTGNVAGLGQRCFLRVTIFDSIYGHQYK